MACSVHTDIYVGMQPSEADLNLYTGMNQHDHHREHADCSLVGKPFLSQHDLM